MLTLLRLLWPFYRRYTGLLLLGVPCVIGVTLLALYPAWVTGRLIDVLATASQAESYLVVLKILGLYLGSLLVLSLVRAALMVGMRLTLVVLSRRVERDHRAYLLQRVLEWDFSTFSQQPLGELMTHFTEDLNRLRNFTGPMVLYGLQVVFLTAFTAAAMLWTEPRLAALSLLPLLFIGPLTYWLRQKALKRGSRQQAAFARLSAFLGQVYPYLRPLRAIADPFALSQKWAHEVEEHRDASLAVTRVEAYLQPVAMLFVGLSLTFVLIYGGVLVAQGELTVGVIGTFSLYVLQLMFPLGAIGWLLSILQQAQVSAQRLLHLQNLPPQITYPAVSRSTEIRPGWRWEGMSFRYTSEGAWILRELTGEIRPGQKLALSLPMGSGKTTFARLLVRQLEPVQGHITFGGHPLSSYSRQDLRRLIGYVPQQPVLLSGTIAQNLRLVAPTASLQELWRALEWAGLADEVAALPKGLHSDIGLWGQQVSGGQRQRLALAMVLLRQPQALLLDETFAPLDSAKIQEIFHHLSRHFAQATWLIFSHRREVYPFVHSWGEGFQVFSPSSSEIGA